VKEEKSRGIVDEKDGIKEVFKTVVAYPDDEELLVNTFSLRYLLIQMKGFCIRCTWKPDKERWSPMKLNMLTSIVETHKQQFRELGGIEKTIRAMERHAKAPRVQEFASFILTNYTHKNRKC
jgi:hypothetical protein